MVGSAGSVQVRGAAGSDRRWSGNGRRSGSARPSGSDHPLGIDPSGSGSRMDSGRRMGNAEDSGTARRSVDSALGTGTFEDAQGACFHRGNHLGSHLSMNEIKSRKAIGTVVTLRR